MCIRDRWGGYTVADATLAGEADWRAYFTPLAEDGNYYTHMPNPTNKYVPVYNAYNGQTETMEAKWADLKKMEEETFAKIITGKADISEFDTFVKNRKSQGGDQILKEINDERCV